MNVPRLLWWALCLALVPACRDNERGNVSRGGAVSADPNGAVRLVFATGSALDSARATKRIRARLDKEGVGAEVAVFGDKVQVDVPRERAERAKEVLAGGRLDVMVLDPTDRLQGYAPAGGVSLDAGFLKAAPAARDALLAAARARAGDAEPLIGPIDGGLRSYFAVKDRRLRGEYLRSARAGGLTFEGAGVGFLQTESGAKATVLVVVDGEVRATRALAEPIKEGILAIDLPDAEQLEGRALSHLTRLVEEKPLSVPPSTL